MISVYTVMERHNCLRSRYEDKCWWHAKFIVCYIVLLTRHFVGFNYSNILSENRFVIHNDYCDKLIVDILNLSPDGSK